MLRFCVLAVACILAVSVGGAQTTTDGDWTIGCKPSSTLNPTLTYDSLLRRFGPENVSSGSLYLGEGGSTRATILFTNDPERRVSIVWRDKQRRKGVEVIDVDADRSIWHTRLQIGPGMPLQQLERLNGGPFQMNGYDTDGLGAVREWNGKLSKVLGTVNDRCYIVVGLNLPYPPPRRFSEQDVENTSGSEVSSSTPVLRKLHLRVNRLRMWTD